MFLTRAARENQLPYQTWAVRGEKRQKKKGEQEGAMGETLIQQPLWLELNSRKQSCVHQHIIHMSFPTLFKVKCWILHLGPRSLLPVGDDVRTKAPEPFPVNWNRHTQPFNISTLISLAHICSYNKQRQSVFACVHARTVFLGPCLNRSWC